MKSFHLLAALAAYCFLAGGAAAAPVANLDDIPYWVGSGTNHSAVVIQWNDGQSPSSVVWGYRWNDADAPTVETMMLDLAGEITFLPTGDVPNPVQPPGGADARLSIAAKAYGFGNLITTISYDQGGLGGDFSATTRDQSGDFAPTWTLYDVGAGDVWPGGAVMPADFGMAGISLEDDHWYGWAFTDAFPEPDYLPVPFTFEAPAGAVPEPSALALLGGGLAVFFPRKRRESARGI